MITRMGSLLLFVGLVGCVAPVRAQRVVASGSHATIQCDGQAYAPVTADEEQALPFELVDKAACGSRVTVLSDPQGYTVMIRTATGKVGYVARHQIAIEAASKPAGPSPAQDENGIANAASSQAAGSPAAQENGPRKPHVYVSDTASWNESGGFGNASSVAPGALYGGYNPEMVDIYQDFTSDCSAITVTQKKTDADFVVLFDKGTPKKGFTGFHGFVKVNKVTVLSRTGETLLSRMERSSDVAAAAACSAVSQPNSEASRKSTN